MFQFRLNKQKQKPTFYGYWQFIREDAPTIYPNGRKVARFICRCTACDKGTVRSIRKDALQQGRSTSCCLGLERVRKANTRHGFRYHPIRQVHRNMLQRCYNPKNEHYKNYGGRGIQVCDEWRNDLGIFARWAMKKGWQKGLTIDRKDNDGDYTPNNCRFVTRKINNNNTRANCKITHKKEKQSFRTFWEKYSKNGVAYGTALHRYRKLSVNPIYAVTIKDLFLKNNNDYFE